MNINENLTITPDDTEFVEWDMTRPVETPKPGDWAYGLTDPMV